MCHPVKQVHICVYAWVFIIPFDIIFLSTHQKQKIKSLLNENIIIIFVIQIAQFKFEISMARLCFPFQLIIVY